MVRLTKLKLIGGMDMYNIGIKKEYIANHALKTHKEPLRRVFTISEELESAYNKDVYDFDYDQLESLFYKLSPKSTKQGRLYFNALEEYIEWCICQAYRRSNISFLATTESKWADKFTVKSDGIDILCQDEEKKDLDKIRESIQSKIGMTVQTGYGPSLVVGIVKSEDDKEYVHLKEFGYEDYHVLIEEWVSLLV